MKHAAESNNGDGFGVVSPDLSAIVFGRKVDIHSRFLAGCCLSHGLNDLVGVWARQTGHSIAAFGQKYS